LAATYQSEFGDVNKMSQIGVNERLVAEFWERVRKQDECKPEDVCWQWTGAQEKHGFGQFHVGKKRRSMAARFSYELEYGKLDKGLVLMHRDNCRNRGCVRPSHLEPVTSGEASRRRRSASYLAVHKELPDSLLAHMPISQLVRPKAHVSPEIGRQSVGLLRSVAAGVRAILALGRRLEEAAKGLGDLATGDDVHAMRDELCGLREAIEQRAGPPPADDVSRETSPPEPEEAPEPEPPPDPRTLDDILTDAFVEACGLEDRPEDQASLSHAFDVALEEAGGNGPGATQQFRSWLAAFAHDVADGADPTPATFFKMVAATSRDEAGTHQPKARTSTPPPPEPSAPPVAPEASSA
jgi:hypothetical protein